jgi:hypothetical protein
MQLFVELFASPRIVPPTINLGVHQNEWNNLSGRPRGRRDVSPFLLGNCLNSFETETARYVVSHRLLIHAGGQCFNTFDPF